MFAPCTGNMCAPSFEHCQLQIATQTDGMEIVLIRLLIILPVFIDSKIGIVNKIAFSCGYAT